MSETETAPQPVLFSADTSRGFTQWLSGQRASLAVTTYQAGKVMFLGTDADGELWHCPYPSG